MSPLRSSAGPAVCTNGASSSAATICASEVLPRPGGPASSTWSSALAARGGRLERDARAARARASWPTKSSRRRGRSERSSSSSPSSVAGVWMRGSSVVGVSAVAPRSALCDAAPRRSRPRRAAEQLVGLGRREAELEQAVAREAPRVVAARDGDRAARRRRRRATFSRSSTMIRSAVRLPMPGTAWKRARVAGGERRDQLARRPAARAPRARPSGRRPARRAASGRGRAPPRSRSRTARARRRGRRGACAA